MLKNVVFLLFLSYIGIFRLCFAIFQDIVWRCLLGFNSYFDTRISSSEVSIIQNERRNRTMSRTTTTVIFLMITLSVLNLSCTDSGAIHFDECNCDNFDCDDDDDTPFSDDDTDDENPFSYLPKLTQINAGRDHVCGLAEDGTPICWGSNQYEQCTFHPDARFSMIKAAGDISCGMDFEGYITCRGKTNYDLSITPNIQFLDFIMADYYHPLACGIDHNSYVTCWGNQPEHFSDAYGEVFQQIAFGNHQSFCGISEGNSTVCYGWLENQPEGIESFVFTQIVGDGGRTICGLKEDGRAACWIDGEQCESTPPYTVFTTLDTGVIDACGLKEDGHAECWGIWMTELDDFPSPPDIPFIDVAVGLAFACGLTEDGTVHCWGHIDKLLEDN